MIHSTVPPGMYVDRVDAGKTTARPPLTIDMTHCCFQAADIVFGAHGGVVRGLVLGAAGTPAVGAPVVLRALDGDVQAKLRSAPWTTTGLDGRFTFSAVPPGRYEVISSMQLGEPEEDEWEYPSGKSVLVEPGKSNDVEIGVTDIPGVQ